MFRGVVNLNLDAKGRMAVPTKYRAILSERFGGEVVITVDPDRCLSIYPLKIWEEIERKLDRMPTFDASARKLQRALIGHATEVEMDANGRLMVPAPLREFAGISKKAVLMGQTRKFELWDAEQFEVKRTAWMDDIKDIAALDLPDEIAGLSL